MNIACYHVDAFTNHVFGGNPAMVCLLDHWLPDDKLQAIATENFLPVTAFLVSQNDKHSVRWFTPEYELDLCGHGTLALGWVIFNQLMPNTNIVALHSNTDHLTLRRNDEHIILDLPRKELESCPAPDNIEQALGLTATKFFCQQNERCVVLFDNEAQIKQLKPNMEILKQLDFRGFTVTAKGDQVDFVSRVFYPHKAISEDAVTGASHCLLAPYWGKQLNKQTLLARQVSPRGGELLCELNGNKVSLSGKATLFMQGTIVVD